MTNYLSSLTAALNNTDPHSACDSDPIHLISDIQPHGVLLLVEEPSLRILRISANAYDILQKPVDSLLGKTLDHALGAHVVDELCAHLFEIRVEKTMVHFLTYEQPYPPGQGYHLFGHRRGRYLLLEIEPVVDTNYKWQNLSLSQLNTRIQHILETGSLPSMLKALTNWIRRSTGFERVMVYRCEDDFSGKVIAETRQNQLESFQDLHFPSTDIPLPARRMFALSPLRHLPNVDYVAVPVQSIDGIEDDERMLDLGYSMLRSVSPLYIEYLKNMGVKATAVLPIMSNKMLWGLISCMNHSTPLYLSPEQRAPLIFVVQMVSTLISELQRADDNVYLSGLEHITERMDEGLEKNRDLHQTLVGYWPGLLKELDVTGVVFMAEGLTSKVGQVPGQNHLNELATWLNMRVQEVYSTSHLVAEFPPAREYCQIASGLLSIRLTRTSNDRIILFRPEVPREIEWAGNPEKPYVLPTTGNQEKPHPRTSFARWKTTMRYRSRPWRDCELEFAARLRMVLLEFMVERSQKLRYRQSN
ncbi:MAG: GAF domain-containing protein [Methylococcaceae bacterium]